jgi:hypothetical protein
VDNNIVANIVRKLINEMFGQSLSAIESTHYINIVLVTMPTTSANTFLIVLTEKPNTTYLIFHKL